MTTRRVFRFRQTVVNFCWSPRLILPTSGHKFAVTIARPELITWNRRVYPGVNGLVSREQQSTKAPNN